jgi:hypothetical protein
MKHGLLICTALAAVALTAPLAVGGDEECWFDLENCAMCKHMLAEEGLMDHMEWETYVITDGMLSVTRIAPGYEEAFERAMDNMEKTGKQLQTGQQMYLCGHCQSYGALHMAGAIFELVETSIGSIDLMTSSDPAVVGMIQTHAQRTIDEYDAMLAEKP